jgi:hypothetical protein
VVVEPGLQVAKFSEIEQVFRQLLQLLQRQINKPSTAVSVEAAEPTQEEPDGQGSGFLLPTDFKSLFAPFLTPFLTAFLTAFLPSLLPTLLPSFLPAHLPSFLATLLQDLLHCAAVAQLLQRHAGDHQNLLLAQLWKSLKQHRENHRLQIPSACQDPPAGI